MNARQTKKKLKNKIKTLESDNKLMRRIIADTPGMQDLYDAYNKPKFVTHTTMQFQEFRVKRMITVPHIKDLDGFIERTKPAFEKALLESIKDNMTYEVDDKETPTITASIFVGKK